MLHKKKSDLLEWSLRYAPIQFQMLAKVKTIYYCHDRRSEVVAHGIIIGMEYAPPLTKKLGWWYKLLVYSIHISSEEHNKMFSKLKINIDDLEEVEIIDVYVHDLIRDKVKIDIIGLIAKLVDLRIIEYKNYHKSEKSSLDLST